MHNSEILLRKLRLRQSTKMRGCISKEETRIQKIIDAMLVKERDFIAGSVRNKSKEQLKLQQDKMS